MTFKFPTPPTLTAAGVDGYLDDLKRTWEARDEPLEVDWHDLELESRAGQLLANGLLGSLGNVHLIVRVPSDERWLKLARSGVVFALANRHRHRTQIVGGDAAGLNLDRWTRSWAPSSAIPFEIASGQGRLWARHEESPYEPNVIGSDHAAFVNPHLAGPDWGETELRAVARPWLRRLLLPRERSDRLDQFIEDTGVLIDELVENVREHAVRDIRQAPTESLVVISVLVGQQARRLHIGVSDTGPGIAATARPKIALRLSDEKLIEVLVRGTYRGWDNARGLGLPRIWDVCEKYRGSLHIATGRTRASVDSDVRTRRVDFELEGTVVNADIRVPRADD